MERDPHRIFTSIERTPAPAFSESRAGNRPDQVDEVSHDGKQYAAIFGRKSPVPGISAPSRRQIPQPCIHRGPMLSPLHSEVTPFFEKSRCDKLAESEAAMSAVMQADLVHRHRLTVEEYFRMAEVGLLAPEARVELIEGEIFDMAPIGNQHGGMTAWLHRRLLRDLGEKISVWDQVTLPLGRLSAPEPDLAVLKYRKDEYRNKNPSPDDVLLIVEVSQSSLRHDRRLKVPLYAKHGIPEVWILDVQGSRIQFFHGLEAGHYTHTSLTPTPGRVSLQALSDSMVDLTGLFVD